MSIQEIEILLNEREEPCVSIIMPTDRINKKKNYEILKKCMQKARALVDNLHFDSQIKVQLTLKIDELVAREPEQVLEGLGIYISPKTTFMIPFPFDVKQQVRVGDGFELRDILFLLQYASPYFVLNLTKEGAHLFKASMNQLEEIKADGFPFLYEDQYEYEHASLSDSSSGSLKSFEKEKGEISAIRLKTVLRDADAHLKSYLTQEDKMLLIAGSQKLIHDYLEISNYKQHFFGKISGSYAVKNFHQLCEGAWQTFIRSKNHELNKMLQSLQEKRNGHLAEGLKDVWNAAQEGRGQVLVVEKDFHHKGYQKEDGRKLLLQPPSKPYKTVEDAVDDIIAMVKDKHGKVVFFENDALKDFGHLALVLRY